MSDSDQLDKTFEADLQKAFKDDPAASTMVHCPLEQKTDSSAGKPAAQGNPCSGLGISTDRHVAEYVADMKNLQKDWPKLSETERLQRLENATNKQLAKSGVPTVKARPKKLQPGNGGNLDFRTWEYNVNEDMIKSTSLSDDDAKRLADTAFHESRHAEQWYLVARLRASEGHTPKSIQTETGMPSSVVAIASKNPLAPDAPQRACATAIMNSVYGKYAAARDNTLTKVMSDLKKYNEAAANLQKVNADRRSTAAEKAAAQTQLTAARSALSSSYKDYRALPEEADAFEAGGKVVSKW